MSVAAHLILGSRAEPFLAATLESLEGAADAIIVNDNSSGPSPHTATLEQSVFGREGCIIVDRSPFSGFADARNVCLRAHAEHGSWPWVAFVDADEVHGPAIGRIASHLRSLPEGVGYVDGYTWHFFQSFDYYTSIERRMMFFRYTPEARWEGSVHEQLRGVAGRRVALPYVYAHYGHTLEPRRHAEKGRHYASLGAGGNVLREDELDAFEVERYFAPVYHRLMRFRGAQPPAARATLERLRPTLSGFQQITEGRARAQSLPVRVRNALRRANYELRWRGRGLDPLARRLLD